MQEFSLPTHIVKNLCFEPNKIPWRRKKIPDTVFLFEIQILATKKMWWSVLKLYKDTNMILFE